MHYLLSPYKHQYMANLHCHSTRSDGRLTPEELKIAYREQGYHVLAITDHESPHDHSALSDDTFLMLTGYEAYIRPDPNCVYDIFSPEIHLNLFARDPHNVTLIGYDPPCCKYLSADEQAALLKAPPLGTRAYTVDYVNAFIASAREHGYLVGYNHPVWSMEDEARVMAYEGCFSMEMINGNSDAINRMEYNGALYDKLLRHGKRLFIHAADDNHNKAPFDDPACDSFRAATVILAEELTYDAIIHAMETGNMYATEGPRLEEIAFDGEQLFVRCSDAEMILCHIGSKHPQSVYAPPGQTVNTATFTVHPAAQYVRISIIDRDGKRADTRAYFREEIGWD